MPLRARAAFYRRDDNVPISIGQPPQMGPRRAAPAKNLFIFGLTTAIGIYFPIVFLHSFAF